MGGTTHEIEAHIGRTRDALGSNLSELERKVKTAADWKQHVRSRPGAWLALSFAGGVILAGIFGGRSKKRCGKLPVSEPVTVSKPPAKASRRSDVALDTWDKVKGALIGAAATHLLRYWGVGPPDIPKQHERTRDEAAATGPAHAN